MLMVMISTQSCTYIIDASLTTKHERKKKIITKKKDKDLFLLLSLRLTTVTYSFSSRSSAVVKLRQKYKKKVNIQQETPVVVTGKQLKMKERMTNHSNISISYFFFFVSRLKISHRRLEKTIPTGERKKRGKQRKYQNTIILAHLSMIKQTYNEKKNTLVNEPHKNANILRKDYSGVKLNTSLIKLLFK